METIRLQAVWIVTGLGLVSLVGVFWRMRGGLHPSNLLAVCAVLILTVVTLVALVDTSYSAPVVFIMGGAFGALIVFIVTGSKKTPLTPNAPTCVTRDELTTAVKNGLDGASAELKRDLALDGLKAELLAAIAAGREPAAQDVRRRSGKEDDPTRSAVADLGEATSTDVIEPAKHNGGGDSIQVDQGTTGSPPAAHAGPDVPAIAQPQPDAAAAGASSAEKEKQLVSGENREGEQDGKKP